MNLEINSPKDVVELVKNWFENGNDKQHVALHQQLIEEAIKTNNIEVFELFHMFYETKKPYVLSSHCIIEHLGRNGKHDIMFHLYDKGMLDLPFVRMQWFILHALKENNYKSAILAIGKIGEDKFTAPMDWFLSFIKDKNDVAVDILTALGADVSYKDYLPLRLAYVSGLTSFDYMKQFKTDPTLPERYDFDAWLYKEKHHHSFDPEEKDKDESGTMTDYEILLKRLFDEFRISW